MTIPEALKYLYEKDAFILDTETTSFGKDDEVIDLAIVSFRTGDVIFNRQFMPTKFIDPSAAAVHGYTLDSLRNLGAKLFSRSAEELERLFNSNFTYIAYNEKFDKRLLKQTFEKNFMPFREQKWHCAQKAYFKMHGLKKNIKLSEACQIYNVTPGQHSALSDTIATRELLLKMKDNYLE